MTSLTMAASLQRVGCHLSPSLVSVFCSLFVVSLASGTCCGMKAAAEAVHCYDHSFRHPLEFHSLC